MTLLPQQPAHANEIAARKHQDTAYAGGAKDEPGVEEDEKGLGCNRAPAEHGDHQADGQGWAKRDGAVVHVDAVDPGLARGQTNAASGLFQPALHAASVKDQLTAPAPGKGRKALGKIFLKNGLPVEAEYRLAFLY